MGAAAGTGVVAEVAVEHPPAGLLLRSPFIDLAGIGQAQFPFLPVRLLLRDRFPQAELIARVTVPTAIVYVADRLVPPEQSLAVAAAAGGPTVVVAVEGAGHNDRALFDGPDLLRAILELAAIP